jgi:hypothetical protein
MRWRRHQRRVSERLNIDPLPPVYLVTVHSLSSRSLSVLGAEGQELCDKYRMGEQGGRLDPT